MKLVVFSDAHGNQSVVDKILELNNDADYVVSLGDSGLEAEYLFQRDIVHVKGNIRKDPGFTYDSTIDVEGHSIFITHGHKYNIHRNVSKLVQHALLNGYDIAMHGHTHIAYNNVVNNVRVLNPGSCDTPRNGLPPTYLILELEKGEMTITFKDVYTNNTIVF